MEEKIYAYCPTTSATIGDSEDIELAANSAIKLPAFWAKDAVLWFSRIEAQFRRSRITFDDAKFDHVVADLEPDVATEVRDILVNPPPKDKYDTLKQAIITRLTDSSNKRLQQVLHKEELGDRTPSQFWRHLQALADTTRYAVRLLATMCTEHVASPEYLITLLQPGTIVNERWNVLKLLGTGSFGVVFKVEDVNDKSNYAMKIELAKEDSLVLKTESFVLKKMKNSSHFCRFIENGVHGKVNYLVMSLVGSNLSDLRRTVKNKRFTISTILRLAVSCLEAIKELHDAGFIHRDIKPANFSTGLGQENRNAIYLLDFGIVRQYIVNNRVRPPRMSVEYGGTARYSSMNAHHGREMYTYDDVIALLFTLAELYKGELPWKVTDTVKETERLKNRASLDDIFGDMPTEVKSMYTSLMKKKYGDLVDYAGMRKQFERIMQEMNITEKDPYDWEMTDDPALQAEKGPKAVEQE
uniref:Protein kinase domain-containing protein n=1 Tax=Trichuris muris TaxID=70415 RepID=A0A5S6QSX6_TRIMR